MNGAMLPNSGVVAPDTWFCELVVFAVDVVVFDTVVVGFTTVVVGFNTVVEFVELFDNPKSAIGLSDGTPRSVELTLLEFCA